MAAADTAAELAASVFTDELAVDPEDAIQIAAHAGYRYVDVRDAWGKSVAHFTRADRDRLRALLRRYGLRLGVIQSPFGKCHIDEASYAIALRELDGMIALAHACDVRVLRVFAFWSDDHGHERVRPSLAPMLPKIADQLGRAARRAEEEGVTLALEPEHTTYGGSISEVRTIVDAVGSQSLQIAWDVTNGLYAEPIFPDAWELVKGRVANVHVKERGPAIGQGAEGHPASALLGAGLVPWPRIIALLRESGFRGLYSIETHIGHAGPYGWQKLQAATTYYLYALRELLEADVHGSEGSTSGSR